jgi:hypothetical protein
VILGQHPAQQIRDKRAAENAGKHDRAEVYVDHDKEGGE